MDSLSTKIEKLETPRPGRTIFKKKLSPSTCDCRRKRRNEMIINTLNEKLDLDITLQDIKRTHRIGEHKKTR